MHTFHGQDTEVLSAFTSFTNNNNNNNNKVTGQDKTSDPNPIVGLWWNTSADNISLNPKNFLYIFFSEMFYRHLKFLIH